MAIYKLGEILKSKPEYGAGLKAQDKGKYRYFRQTDMISGGQEMFVDKHENKFIKKGDLLISRAGSAGIPYYHESDEKMVYAGYLVKYPINEDIAITKFVYYSLLTEGQQIKSLLTGAVQPNFNPPVAMNLILEIPSIEEQQKIIDIIEPIERLIDNNNKIFDNIKILEKKLIIDCEDLDIEFNFIKGSLPSKEPEGKTKFLNVSAANGKPNRFVTNEKNIFIGDVTLSLDGNCGLVNNALEGYNGYLYKVTAENIDNWQVFYSLLTTKSQNIIKLNETGTTIKHATGAKKELRVMNFQNKDVLEKIFDLRIKIINNLEKMEYSKERMMKLLIK